jgi:tRNA(adenine34) deaminase
MTGFTEFDKKFMREALLEAQEAFKEDEVPVGAVLVKENRIISRGRNCVEKEKNATKHAEIVCLSEGAKILGDWRLLDTILYVTMEPCSMCAGAAILSRVTKIIWGCPDIRHGACGSWTDLFIKPHPIHQIQIQSGLFEEEARALLQNFFRNKRKSHAVR